MLAHRRALEGNVLQEVCSTVIFSGLIPGASINPYADCGSGSHWRGLSCYTQAVWEGRDLHLACGSIFLSV